MTPSGHLLRPEPGDTPAPTTNTVSGDGGWTLLDITDRIGATVGPYLMAGTAVALVALLGLSLVNKRRRNTDTTTSRDEITSTDRAITRITAFIATAVLAQGMWAFFTDVIHVAWYIKVVLFSFTEMQIIAATRRATRHLYRHGTLGTAPRTVLGLAAASATIAAIHASTLDERLFRLFAAGVAAYMWIEELREERDILHHKNPGVYPPIKRLNFDWSDRVELFFARHGLLKLDERTVSQLDRAHRIGKFVRTVFRLHQMQVSGAAQWRVRRAEQRRDRQVVEMNEVLNLATDRTVMVEVQRQLATLYQAREGVTEQAVRTLDPWAVDIETGRAADTGPDVQQTPRADSAGDTSPHTAIDTLSGLMAMRRPDAATGQHGNSRPDMAPTRVLDSRRTDPADPRPDTRSARGRRRTRTPDQTPKWTSQQLRAFKMRDEDDLTHSAIARKLSVSEKTIGRWFKAREKAEEAQQTLALGPDVLLPLPEPKAPVMSGTNGHHINVKEETS